MPTIIVTDRSGKPHSLAISPGTSLMQTLCENGLDEVLALCGGVCSCGTCHVYINRKAHALEPMSDDEDLILQGVEQRLQNSRLSCQIFLSDAHEGLSLTIAPE